MKLTVISIAIGALDIIIQGLVRELDDLEIRGQVEIIQTTAILSLAKILRKVL